MNTKKLQKSFDYLDEDNLRQLPLAALVKNIYKRLREIDEPTSSDNICQVLDNFNFENSPQQVDSLLERFGLGPGGGLDEFKQRLVITTAGSIEGYEQAKSLVTNKIKDDLEDMLNTIDRFNMFGQRDGDYFRYDPQNPGVGFQNYQIQVGGKNLFVKKTKKIKKTSVTGVLVDDAIIKICNSDSQIAAHVADLMKAQHRKSYQTGKFRKISLK